MCATSTLGFMPQDTLHILAVQKIKGLTSPLGRLCVIKQEAHQLVVLGKTPRHSTLQSTQTFSQVQCAITGDLASNHDRIMLLYASRTRFTHFYSVLHCILQSIGRSYSDVISGIVVDPTGADVHVKFGDSRSNLTRAMRLPHFVTDDDERHRHT